MAVPQNAGNLEYLPVKIHPSWFYQPQQPLVFLARCRHRVPVFNVFCLSFSTEVCERWGEKVKRVQPETTNMTSLSYLVVPGSLGKNLKGPAL